jgi:hypothetical protein
MSSSVRGRGTTDKPHTVEKLECGELRIVVCRGTLTQTLALGRAYPWVCLRFRVLTLACAYACVCVPIATWVCLPIFSLYASPYPQWLVLSLCLVCWMPPRGGGGGVTHGCGRPPPPAAPTHGCSTVARRTWARWSARYSKVSIELRGLVHLTSLASGCQRNSANASLMTFS